MFRRSLLELSNGASRKWLQQTKARIPSFAHSGRSLPFATRSNSTSATHEKLPTSKSFMPKIALGGTLLAGIVFAAYQAGYIQKQLGADKTLPLRSSEFVTKKSTLEHETRADEETLNLNKRAVNEDFVTIKEESVRTPILDEHKTDISEKIVQDKVVKDALEESNSLPSTDSPGSSDTAEVKDLGRPLEVSKEGLHLEKSGSEVVALGSEKENNDSSNTALHHEEIGEAGVSENHLNTTLSKDNVNNELKVAVSLSDAYVLNERGINEENLKGEAVADDGFTNAMRKENLGTANGKSNDAVLGDGIIIVDLLEAIHAAEKKQANQDAKIYAEEKRNLKEKYEKELKDARARELMYAEEAALLDKELNRERAKSAAALKSFQEKADEKLKLELQQKEEESEMRLKIAQELAMAELTTAIAKEKACQIEKMAEAKNQVDELLMAFFAKSDESRHSQTAHELALAVIALEDALSKGLPVQTEINTLYSSLKGTGSATNSDELLSLVITSLPKETLEQGAKTPLQLNQNFDALKDVLRHYVLIPAGGGGMLTHSIAHVASMIKMKEDGQYDDSIESVITRVDNLLAEGKLSDAADLVENSVCGSEASGVVVNWVKQARNRAILEQALILLRSLATSISLADS